MRATSTQIDALASQFESASPQEILRWATDTYGNKLAIVTSFQITGIVTLHMLQRIAPQTSVLTLDTGLLFPETYNLIDTLEHQLNLNLKRVKPSQNLQQQAHEYGRQLWIHDPDKCCHLRKTIPLNHALEGYTAWLTGLRRDQSEKRSTTPIISIDSHTGLTKIAPFANWTASMLWMYIKTYNLPYNVLHDRGYPSIGCRTCTQAIKDGDHMRSGRWARTNKTECGIHIDVAMLQS